MNNFPIQDDKIWEKHELEQLPEVRAKINTFGEKYIWKRQIQQNFEKKNIFI